MLFVFQYSDPLYLKSVQSAVETGVPCLLENVGENLDPGRLSVCRSLSLLLTLSSFKRNLVKVVLLYALLALPEKRTFRDRNPCPT